MRIVIVNNSTKHIDNLVAIFAQHKAVVFNTRDMNVGMLAREDVLVLSGGSQIPVYGHDDIYGDLLEIIKTHNGPIIGICLGLQLIAKAYEVPLKRMNNNFKRSGLQNIRMTASGSNIFEKNDYTVFEAHRWYVGTDDVRPPLMTLAESDDGAEIIKHESKPIIATQFHPEANHNNDGLILLRALIKEYINYDITV